MNVPESQPNAPNPATLHDEELIDFVRETVMQLNKLADRLEVYAKECVDTARSERDDSGEGGGAQRA